MNLDNSNFQNQILIEILIFKRNPIIKIQCTKEKKLHEYYLSFPNVRDNSNN